MAFLLLSTQVQSLSRPISTVCLSHAPKPDSDRSIADELYPSFSLSPSHSRFQFSPVNFYFPQIRKSLKNNAHQCILKFYITNTLTNTTLNKNNTGVYKFLHLYNINNYQKYYRLKNPFCRLKCAHAG